jgi:hypothetical protein
MRRRAQQITYPDNPILYPTKSPESNPVKRESASQQKCISQNLYQRLCNQKEPQNIELKTGDLNMDL